VLGNVATVFVYDCILTLHSLPVQGTSGRSSLDASISKGGNGSSSNSKSKAKLLGSDNADELRKIQQRSFRAYSLLVRSLHGSSCI
jgi:hypothetical protein